MCAAVDTFAVVEPLGALSNKPNANIWSATGHHGVQVAWLTWPLATAWVRKSA